MQDTMRSLPYEHGFAPDGWKGIVNVEILKKAGVYDIEKDAYYHIDAFGIQYEQ